MGVYIHGMANMYDYVSTSYNAYHKAPSKLRQTKDDVWRQRVWGALNGSGLFFDNNIMTEVACESLGTCNYDQRSFKSYLSIWLAGTSTLVPDTYDYIKQRLAASAVAAAAQCSGGTGGTTCGLRWTQLSAWDGSYGPGEQMAAMSVFGKGVMYLKSRQLAANTI